MPCARSTRRVEGGDGDPLARLAEATLEAIPSAAAVSLTVLERGRFTTRAATDDLAMLADALQYELGRGPCVDAVLDNTANLSGDVAQDDRWGEWGPHVAADLGVRSVLAYRLVLEGEQRAIASLNVYGTEAHAFDEEALHPGGRARHARVAADGGRHGARRRGRAGRHAGQTGRWGWPWGCSCTVTGSPASRPSTSCAWPASRHTTSRGPGRRRRRRHRRPRHAPAIRSVARRVTGGGRAPPGPSGALTGRRPGRRAERRQSRPVVQHDVGHPAHGHPGPRGGGRSA